MKKHNDQPIHEVLKDFLKSNKMSKGYYDAQVRKIWQEKIGKLLVEQTEKIYFAKGIVYIKLNSAPLRHQLLIGKSQLIENFNKELNETIVQDIKLN